MSTNQQIAIKKLWQNPAYRKHMSEAHLGQVAWNKGKKTGLVPKTAFKKNDKRLLGEKHHNWKGDKVGYFALHNWIKRKLGKATYCANDKEHKAPCYHWSNIVANIKETPQIIDPFAQAVILRMVYIFPQGSY